MEVLFSFKALPKSHSLHKCRDYLIPPALKDTHVLQTHHVYGLYSDSVPNAFFYCLPPFLLLGHIFPNIINIIILIFIIFPLGNVTYFLILGISHMLMTPAPSALALLFPQSINIGCFISSSKCSKLSSYCSIFFLAMFILFFGYNEFFCP